MNRKTWTSSLNHMTPCVRKLAFKRVPEFQFTNSIVVLTWVLTLFFNMQQILAHVMNSLNQFCQFYSNWPRVVLTVQSSIWKDSSFFRCTFPLCSLVPKCSDRIWFPEIEILSLWLTKKCAISVLITDFNIHAHIHSLIFQYWDCGECSLSWGFQHKAKTNSGWMTTDLRL